MKKNQCIFYILNKVVMLGFIEKTAQNVQTTAYMTLVKFKPEIVFVVKMDLAAECVRKVGHYL